MNYFNGKVETKTEKLNESLLSVWLRLSTSIINSRVVNELSYNESLVCNLIYNNLSYQETNPLTATDLCNKTNMLKSQMNRTLNMLENKGIVTRERSVKDKRQVYVLFNKEKADAYEVQHSRILRLLDAIIAEIGEDKIKGTIDTLTNIADIAGNVLGNK